MNRLRLLLLPIALGAASSQALGPGAPFDPPRSTVAAPPASVADGAAGGDGLTGIALKRPPSALIDGQWRQVGDRLRGARLSRIDSRGVLLKHDDGRDERLWLAPPLAPPQLPKVLP